MSAESFKLNQNIKSFAGAYECILYDSYSLSHAFQIMACQMVSIEN